MSCGTRCHNPHIKSWALFPASDTYNKLVLSLFCKFGRVVDVDGLLESVALAGLVSNHTGDAASCIGDVECKFFRILSITNCHCKGNGEDTTV